MSAHLSVEMHQLALKRIGKQPIRKMPQSGNWLGATGLYDGNTIQATTKNGQVTTYHQHCNAFHH